jgi:hypothetical protein
MKLKGDHQRTIPDYFVLNWLSGLRSIIDCCQYQSNLHIFGKTHYASSKSVAYAITFFKIEILFKS